MPLVSEICDSLLPPPPPPTPTRVYFLCYSEWITFIDLSPSSLTLSPAPFAVESILCGLGFVCFVFLVTDMKFPFGSFYIFYFVLIFVARLFLMAYSSIFIMAAFTSLSDNSNIDVISASSVDYFSSTRWNFFVALCGVIFYCSVDIVSIMRFWVLFRFYGEWQSVLIGSQPG